MEKKIKIIDILCYISIGEYDKVPKRIKYKDIILTYDEEVQDYYRYWGKGLFVYLFLERDDCSFLNDEVQILDSSEEFEDIEVTGWALPVTELEKHFGDKINALIKNQKKIISRLKDE